MKIKELIDDYERRLATAVELKSNFKSNGSEHDIRKAERLNTKFSEYQAFISDLRRLEPVGNTDYFKVVPTDNTDRIEIECGRNGHAFLIRTDVGMVIDIYANGNDEIVGTMGVWDEDMNNERDFTDDLSEEEQQPTTPTYEEIGRFTREWGQSHSEICENLEYDKKTSDDLLMVDYFWLEKAEQWYPIISTAYTEREQEIADYLRHNS